MDVDNIIAGLSEAGELKLREKALSLFYLCPEVDEVDKRRIAAINHKNSMTGFQKTLSKMGDFENARLFKQEAAEAMKEYRGACLVLGHLAPGGDSPFRRTKDWPLELIPYAIRAAY